MEIDQPFLQETPLKKIFVGLILDAHFKWAGINIGYASREGEVRGTVGISITKTISL